MADKYRINIMYGITVLKPDLFSKAEVGVSTTNDKPPCTPHINIGVIKLLPFAAWYWVKDRIS